MIFNSLLAKVFGTPSDRYLKSNRTFLKKIHDFYSEYAKLNDADLVALTTGFRKRLQQGESLDDLKVEAFAACKEACDRRIGIFNIFRDRFQYDFSLLSPEFRKLAENVKQRIDEGEAEHEIHLPAAFYEHFRSLHSKSLFPFRLLAFDVQLLGGLVLHEGNIAEMQTGEGKTLAAAFPIYLNGLSGDGVHVVTVNDYLASRDAELMGRAYRFLGLSVGVIVHGLNGVQRRDSYSSDVTYGTNNEFGFDYLRDNMADEAEDLVQGNLNFCIVDEVDSILIDEARTPLIISGPAEQSTDKYQKANKLVAELKKDRHFNVDEKNHNVTLTDEGVSVCESRLEIENLYGEMHSSWVHHILSALKANYLYTRDVDYIVNQRREVVIVDEHTGRLMEGRRYSEGLHQAIEAKEKVPIARENQTLATITFQNFFRMYNKLSGMTGTAETEATEFSKIYNLGVVVVPTNRPCIRKDGHDLIYRNEREKYEAIATDIKERHDRGQPILVGTVSIEKSEKLAKLLKRQGIKYDLLNAKQHEREAEIVESAGQKGRVTIATNMAGRGTDIVLGEGVREEGGLYVLATERHESRRIDNQLRGRSGRQGDPGSTRFYLSLDDDLMRIFGSDRIRSIMDKLGAEEGEVITHPFVNRAIANAQKRVEGQNFESRKHLLEYDDVMNEQRKVVYGLRRRILDEEDVQEEVRNRMEEAIDIRVSRHIGSGYPEDWDLEALASEVHRVYGVEWKLSEDVKVVGAEGILDSITEACLEKYDALEDRVEVSEIRNLERRVLLLTIDQIYKEHLLAMDHLRDAIRFQGYAQKDPLMVYKKEGFSMFEEALENVASITTERLLNVRVDAPVRQPVRQNPTEVVENSDEIKSGGGIQNRQSAGPQDSSQVKRQPVRQQFPKVGRNDPCPCGSGKKFKKCHGLKGDKMEKAGAN